MARWCGTHVWTTADFRSKMERWMEAPSRLLLLRRIVATDTNTVDDCLHLADYIRGGVGVVGGGEGHFAALAGEEERKWMEDPKEEEKEWADGEKGPNWKIS